MHITDTPHILPKHTIHCSWASPEGDKKHRALSRSRMITSRKVFLTAVKIVALKSAIPASAHNIGKNTADKCMWGCLEALGSLNSYNDVSQCDDITAFP